MHSLPDLSDGDIIRSATRWRRALQRGAAAAVALALVAGCSTGGATSGSSAGASSGATGATAVRTATSTADDGDLFDDSFVHDIAITFDDAEYDAMIATYQSTGEKTWIKATVTIDGVTYRDVGIRLKGNSSLMSLRGNGRTGGAGATVSADSPEGLPWLVRLDKYVDGQAANGTTELVVRSNNSQTSLNEAVALDLLELSGQASEEAFATRFSVNGSAQELRLVVENPGEEWDDANFSSDGILYKAESTGDYSYRGDDPAAYDEVFEQETGDEDDLTPLIAFLKFINQSDDATFAAQLADHLDVQAFATYLATQQLIDNFDDIDGPGNNSYLRYDADTGRMTVITWDLNLAFGGLGGQGGAQGGVAPGGGAMPAVNGGAATNGAATRTAPTGAPGAAAAGAANTTTANGAVRAGGPSGRSNILVTRFMANATFKAAYDQALASLKAQLYGSGAATGVLERWTALLTSQATDLVDGATVQQEAAKISAYFTS